MSHFECRLNQRFWRSKKLYKLSKLGGRSAAFFRDPFPSQEGNKPLTDSGNGVLQKYHMPPLVDSRIRGKRCNQRRGWEGEEGDGGGGPDL